VAVAVIAAVLGWSAGALGQSEPRVLRPGKKYALLVGVDRYGRGTLLPGLTYPQRDVEGLAEVLIDSGYARDDVVVMTRKSGSEEFDLLPEAAHIRNQLSLLLKPLKPGDSILVMLAGHGVLMDAPPPGGGKPVPASFFCPMDADLRQRDPAKLIAFDEFFAGLAASKATTKLLLIDACRNELKAAPPEARAPGIEMPPPPPPPPPSVAALYACSENEVSWEDSGLGGGHGVFSHFVIEGLKGAADENGDRNGATTLNELTEYVQDNVFQFVRTRHAVSQEPRLLANNVPRIVLRDVSGLRPADLITTRIGGIRLKLIPAGEFLMGSSKADDPDALDDETPRHRVRISRPFYLGLTEVTQGQYRAVTGQSPSRFKGSDDLPVESVSWNEAIQFCNTLSEREGLKPYYQFGPESQSGGDGYRLPTEAEWEYACRARTTTRYSFGDDPAALDAHGWVEDNSNNQTHPVGQKRPNGFGLHDMHGNVWEWCWDGYDAKYYAQSPIDDPRGPPAGASDRVIRGGCWSVNPQFARSADRYWLTPVDRGIGLGFRLARGQSGSR
jgi:formylglycine-generating enzyme required for sulfatase activity